MIKTTFRTEEMETVNAFFDLEYIEKQIMKAIMKDIEENLEPFTDTNIDMEIDKAIEKVAEEKNINISDEKLKKQIIDNLDLDYIRNMANLEQERQSYELDINITSLNDVVGLSDLI